ncbi:MAG: molybdenum cofactor carrier [Rhodospirillaceae bacterium]|nr:molybdenum cofactor carrier [Rhodospirillaceae bacterium]MBT5457906.1 molybdenum cofactor carrier [Rhodospirillaceae bacterium]
MISLRIISGGQTGVDRAALDAALALGIDCGGWCPKGRRAEDGRIADHYPLQETESRDYARRTKANVQDSEGTLIILNDREATVSGGTRLTVKQAEKSDCALLVINVASDATAAVHAIQTVDWIIENQITVLNVAGPRESGSPGIYDAAYNLMTRILADFTRSRS